MSATTDDVDTSAPAPAKPRARPRRRIGRRLLQLLLMASLPVALLAGGGYVYLTGGRYVSTDDAYVKSDVIPISTDVSQRVVEIDVHENELVRTGQVLFRLSDRNFRIAVDKAKAQLAGVKLQIGALRATYRQKQADLKAAQDTIDYARREFDRQQKMLAEKISPQSKFDEARHNLDAARQQAAATEQQLANVLASLAGNPDLPVEEHPRVREAQAQLDQAELDLSHTVITAPANGIVTKVDALPVGTYVNASTPVFSLVATDNLWIEANFKETDLTHMKAGQEAVIDVDTYPDRSFKGRVASISPGTGAEFSLLPPQNATGNWVKVVQRVPVRFIVEGNDAEHPLRAGMSVTVEVDTKYQRPMLSMIRSALAGTSPSR